MESWWAFILLGLVCGIYSSMFGVGAGTLMIPALVLIFSLPQKSAQGISLSVMVPMVLIGSLRYIQNPDIEVDLKLVGILAVGGMAGAWIGASLAAKLPAVVLRRMFAVLLILLSIRMLLKPAAPSEKNAAVPEASSRL